jgi:hypothetical protein
MRLQNNCLRAAVGTEAFLPAPYEVSQTRQYVHCDTLSSQREFMKEVGVKEVGV